MRNAFLFFFGVSLVLAVSACTPSEKADAIRKPDKVAIPVEAGHPARSDISAYFETTGRVLPENSVEIMAKGAGQCLMVAVEEGDVVEANQVLAELDKEELEAQIRQTRVTVAQNKTTMGRAQESAEEGIGSDAEYDNARFTYEQAVASLGAQEVQLKNLTIRAPIAGIITQRSIQQGMLVSAGMPAFTVVDPESYILPINLPEKELMNLEVGQEAKVTIDSQKGREFTATVLRINPSVDPMSGLVKVTLDFDAETRKYLRASAFARVQLIMETRGNVLVVPKDTVIEENGRNYVMVIREQLPEADGEAAEGEASPAEPELVVERVEIATGLEDSDFVEILSGMDDNTRIVTLGQYTLKPGSVVTVTNAEKELLSRVDMTSEEALALAQERREHWGG